MHSFEEVDALRDALFGRSVVSVKRIGGTSLGEDSWGPDVEGEVHLDDGTVLQLAGNIGGCSCGGGDYLLTQLNDMPINGITDVQVIEDGEGYNTLYKIFVLAQDDRIQLAEFTGDDGSGYYGTGFWFNVIKENEDA